MIVERPLAAILALRSVPQESLRRSTHMSEPHRQNSLPKVRLGRILLRRPRQTLKPSGHVPAVSPGDLAPSLGDSCRPPRPPRRDPAAHPVRQLRLRLLLHRVRRQFHSNQIERQFVGALPPQIEHALGCGRWVGLKYNVEHIARCERPVARSRVEPPAVPSETPGEFQVPRRTGSLIQDRFLALGKRPARPAAIGAVAPPTRAKLRTPGGRRSGSIRGRGRLVRDRTRSTTSQSKQVRRSVLGCSP